MPSLFVIGIWPYVAQVESQKECRISIHVCVSACTKSADRARQMVMKDNREAKRTKSNLNLKLQLDVPTLALTHSLKAPSMKDSNIEGTDTLPPHISTARVARARRVDGVVTKQQLLEAAGEVFADFGVAHATGKMIIKRAGTNSAAVNYYFGGIDGLYEAVLTEAHNRVVGLEFLKEIMIGDTPAIHKLNCLIEGVLKIILNPGATSWALRVLGREILNPTSQFFVLKDNDISQKRTMIVQLISDVLGVEKNHPAVAKCLFSIAAPVDCLLAGTPAMLMHLASSGPSHDAMNVDDIVNYFQTFIMGGLNAIKKNISVMRSALEYSS